MVKETKEIDKDKISLSQSEKDEKSAYFQNIFEKDSDNDGLKDWEEVLWKTDPNNPDSDKDGVSDGEEIKINRNPAKPGPNDELDDASLESRNMDDEFFENLFPEQLVFENFEEKSEIRSINEGNKRDEINKPNIFSISPPKGPLGTMITINGSGFTPNGNTVYAGYAVISGLRSLDGKTLVFKVEPDLPKGIERIEYPIIYWFYVKNINGLSNYGKFRLSL